MVVRNSQLQQVQLTPDNTVETMLRVARNEHDEETVKQILDGVRKAKPERNGIKAMALVAFLELMYAPFLDENGESGQFIQLSFKSRSVSDRDHEYMSAVYYGLRRIRFQQVANQLILKNAMQTCAYLGINPRVEVHKREETNKEIQATSSHVEQSAVVWIDVDAKTVNPEDPESGKQEILQMLDARLPKKLKPSMIVDSGNGYHLYFLLDKPYPVTDVSDVCHRLEEYLGIADHCHNPDRIFRAPLTINWKDINKGKRTGFVKFTETRYKLEDFAFLPKQAKRPSEFFRADISGMDQARIITIDELKQRVKRDLNLPEKVTLPIHEYEEKYSQAQQKTCDRSRRDFHCVCQMIKEGFTPDEIRDVMYSFPEGVGEKFHERLEKYGEDSANRYAAITIEKCMQAIEDEKRRNSRIVVIEEDRF